MASSSSALARPENAAASVTAAPNNTFHVLNSGSGAGGHASAGGVRPPPQAAAFRSPPVRGISTGYPGTGIAVPSSTMAARSSSGTAIPPQMVQQLMMLAGWGTRPPWLPQNYYMSPRGQPPPLMLPSPSSIRPPSFAVQSSGGPAVGSSSASRRRKPPPNVTPLEITTGAVVTRGNGPALNKKKSPPAAAAGSSSSSLPPVLAMPTTAGAQGTAAANGRVRKRVTKEKDHSDKPESSSSRKPRLQRQPGPTRSSDLLQIVPISPPPSNSNMGKKRKGRCNLVARRSSTVATAAPPKKHTVLTWLIDAGFLSDGEKVFYVPEGTAAEKIVSGAVTRTGVHCSCCDAVVPLPVFAAHAGRDPGHQRPWEKLLLVSGSSLLGCMQEAWEKERVKTFQAQEKLRAALEQEKDKISQQIKRRLLLAKQQKKGVVISPRMKKVRQQGDKDSSDDACGVCADGGELLCCDTCPSTFHPECLAMDQVPEGSWACHYCRCMLCMANDDQGLSTCQRCTGKYHQHCRPLLNNGQDIGAYCSETCKKLCAQLSDMIGVTNHTEDGFSWALLKIQKDELVSSPDMSLVLESNLKLAVGLGVLNECFNPVKDRRTKIDMLHQAVYSLGSEFKRLSYEGFCTIILEKAGEIISVALLRFHGRKMAEMPFACTLPTYRKQGMMRRLVKAIDQVLASVQVETLVIPAIDTLVDTWTKSFSFRPVEPQFWEGIKRLNLVVITGTTLLCKPVAVQQSPSPRQQAGSSEPWWLKYTVGAPPLTDDERAFLEMDTFGGSFTDLLLTDNVSLHKMFAGHSPFVVPSAASPGSSIGDWRSCGEASAMVLQPAFAHGNDSSLLHGMK